MHLIFILIATAAVAQAESRNLHLTSKTGSDSESFFLARGDDPAGAGRFDSLSQTSPTADSSTKPPPPSEWEFEIAPYLWATSLKTDVSLGPISVTSDACFTDLLKDLDFAAMMRFEGRKDRWGFYLEGMYVNLNDDGRAKVGPFRFRGLETEVRFIQASLDFGGMYRFGDSGRSFDVLFGGRYAHLETTASLGPLGGDTNNTDWVTPVIGGQMQLELAEKWLFSLKADMGGFSVGDAPDLTWGATALLGYRYSECATIGFGYRYYDIHSDDGDDNLDIRYHGPMVGVAFRF